MNWVFWKGVASAQPHLLLLKELEEEGRKSDGGEGEKERRGERRSELAAMQT